MRTIGIIVFLIIKVTLCCDDPNQISLLPPFQDKNNIQSRTGEDLNIICCHPDGADSLSWQDKAKNEIVYTSSNGVFSLKDEKNRLILRIDNIAESKTGEYTCTNTRKRLSKSITISAETSFLKPEIIQKKILYPDNKPIQIKCPLGNNQGFKNWIFTRKGKKLVVSKSAIDGSYTISDDKSLFTITTNPETAKISMVWCQFQEVAVNGDVKTGLYEFTWRSYEPIDLNLIVDHKGPILESTNVKIICSFRYSDELSVAFPSDMVLKPNMMINNNKLSAGKVVLTIKKITKDSDGVYQCKVTKFIDLESMTIAEEVASVKIEVVVPPKIISNEFVKSTAKVGDSASLVCQIKGIQLAKEDVYFEHFLRDSSEWRKLVENNDKYGVKFMVGEISSLTLLIKDVSWDDRGKYRCVVKNTAGSDKQVGLFKVEKTPELISTPSPVYMSTKPVKIDCTLSGFPIYSSDDILELQVLSKGSPLTLNLIDRRNEDSDGFSVSYEVMSQGELTAISSYSLQCYYKNKQTNEVKTKLIELKVAEKPNIPIVRVVCSGSSGVVFMSQKEPSEDKNKKIVKNVLSYAPSKNFDSMTNKPSIVIPINAGENAIHMSYVLKDLVPSRDYTFKWEGYNEYGLSNERILNYSTKNIMLPQTPETLSFSPKGNMISANVSWKDDCPYAGSNIAIRDIVVKMKPFQVGGKDNNNMQWVESNFTVDTRTSSAQFLISLENPQIDYEIQVALRSALGGSESLTAIYRANSVLTGSLFSCFPRCASRMLSWNLSLLPLAVVSLLLKFRL